MNGKNKKNKIPHIGEIEKEEITNTSSAKKFLNNIYDEVDDHMKRRRYDEKDNHLTVDKSNTIKVPSIPNVDNFSANINNSNYSINLNDNNFNNVNNAYNTNNEYSTNNEYNTKNDYSKNNYSKNNYKGPYYGMNNYNDINFSNEKKKMKKS